MRQNTAVMPITGKSGGTRFFYSGEDNCIRGKNCRYYLEDKFYHISTSAILLLIALLTRIKENEYRCTYGITIDFGDDNFAKIAEKSFAFEAFNGITMAYEDMDDKDRRFGYMNFWSSMKQEGPYITFETSPGRLRCFVKFMVDSILDEAEFVRNSRIEFSSIETIPTDTPFVYRIRWKDNKEYMDVIRFH